MEETKKLKESNGIFSPPSTEVIAIHEGTSVEREHNETHCKGSNGKLHSAFEQSKC